MQECRRRSIGMRIHTEVYWFWLTVYMSNKKKCTTRTTLSNKALTYKHLTVVSPIRMALLSYYYTLLRHYYLRPTETQMALSFESAWHSRKAKQFVLVGRWPSMRVQELPFCWPKQFVLVSRRGSVWLWMTVDHNVADGLWHHRGRSITRSRMVGDIVVDIPSGKRGKGRATFCDFFLHIRAFFYTFVGANQCKEME